MEKGSHWIGGLKVLQSDSTGCSQRVKLDFILDIFHTFQKQSRKCLGQPCFLRAVSYTLVTVICLHIASVILGPA